VTVLRLFRKIKLTRKVDLGHLHLISPGPSLSVFLSIVKKTLHVRVLSIYDFRRGEESYKGLFATYPKYIKQLKSLCTEISVQSSGGFLPNRIGGMPEKMMFLTDYLRYLPHFEEIKITYPFFQQPLPTNRACHFKKFPSSIRKISIQHPREQSFVRNPSIEHLKGLKDFEISFMRGSTLGLLKSTYLLIPQVSLQLEA